MERNQKKHPDVQITLTHENATYILASLEIFTHVIHEGLYQEQLRDVGADKEIADFFFDHISQFRTAVGKLPDGT